MKKKATLTSMTLLVVLATALLGVAHITQHCTPGFFKNHTQFFSGYSCLTFDPSTPVSTYFHSTSSCVGNLTLLQAIAVPSSFCADPDKGLSQLNSGEIIMLRQVITRILNATNSNPIGCDAVGPTISTTNVTVDQSITLDDKQPMIDLANRAALTNDDSVCTIGQ